MDSKKKRTVSIVTFCVAIFAELIACLLWLVPISGFIIYPFVSGFALLLNLVSWIFAKGNKGLRVLNYIVGVVLTVTILADVIFLIRFILGVL